MSQELQPGEAGINGPAKGNKLNARTAGVSLEI